MSDFNDDFDEFGDDNFADEPAELSAKQQQRLNKFQDNVKRAMRVVTNEAASVDSRVKAAQWLGESGEPTAITGLRQAYMNASDKKVRQAAHDSLGMFRALQQALEDPEQAEEVQGLLQGIIFEGKVGGVSGAVQMVRRLQVILGITFVLLMGVGVMASTGLLGDPNAVPTLVPTPTIFLSPTPLPTVPPTDFVGDLLHMHDDLVFDAELLAERFQLAIQQVNIGCDVTTFRAPDEYSPPPGFEGESYPLVDEFITRLNSVRTELEALRATYDEACATQTPIEVETANTQWDELIVIQTQLNTEFVTILEDPSFIPGQEIATPTPRPSPTPFPTPTVEPSVINQIIRTIEFNIDEMNQPIIGENNRLIQFWSDLEIAGTTDGCRDGTPLLPEDYVVTEEDRAELPIDLIEAIDAYNLAMTLSRDSWARFEIACLSDEPNIQQGRSQAELAQTSFNGATESLNKLKS